LHALGDELTSEELARVEVVVNMTIEPALAAKLKNARVMQLTLTGTDLLNFSVVPPHWAIADIHQGGTSVSEYVIGTMFAHSLGLLYEDRNFRSCTWQAGPNSCSPNTRHFHSTLKGQTVGIVGYGTIGREVAARAHALGVRVVAVDARPPKECPPELEWIGDDSRLPDLLAAANFTVLAVPLVPATRGLIGAGELARMQPDGVLINVARGAVVDEAALYEALEAKRIGGAVLDVWWHPFAWYSGDKWPADRNFTALPNVIMTPHIASDTAQAIQEAVRQIAKNFDHFARGQPLENVVRNGTQAIVV
jgi:phosphoglycerate dehydrogenase-like enzyme